MWVQPILGGWVPERRSPQAKCELLAENAKMIASQFSTVTNDLLMATAAKVWQGETLTYGLRKRGKFMPRID